MPADPGPLGPPLCPRLWHQVKDSNTVEHVIPLKEPSAGLAVLGKGHGCLGYLDEAIRENSIASR
jgi:hypothetical protein